MFLKISAYIIVCVNLGACFTPKAVKQTRLQAESLMSGGTVESERIATDVLDMHFVTRGATDTLLVFIHGTPGSWEIFSAQLSDEALASFARLIAIDRPGWGETRFKERRVKKAMHLSEQAQLIGPALLALKQKYSARRMVLVGHSLGASLVPRIALDFPEVVDGIVSIAGDLSKDYPATQWYNFAGDSWVFGWLLSSSMKKANEEVLILTEGLAEMSNRWHDLHVPYLVLQGSLDGLVDPRHADFAKSLVTVGGVTVKVIPQGDHLMHVTYSDDVNHTTLEWIRVSVNASNKD